MAEVLIWASPSMYYAPRGGGSEWRLIVFRREWSARPVTSYEWRTVRDAGWRSQREWPSYDFNNGSTLGLPPVTRELWKVWQHEVKRLIEGDEFAGAPTEPTAAGLQYVMPGCEKDRSRSSKPQLELF